MNTIYQLIVIIHQARRLPSSSHGILSDPPCGGIIMGVIYATFDYKSCELDYKSCEFGVLRGLHGKTARL